MPSTALCAQSPAAAWTRAPPCCSRHDGERRPSRSVSGGRRRRTGSGAGAVRAAKRENFSENITEVAEKFRSLVPSILRLQREPRPSEKRSESRRTDPPSEVSPSPSSSSSASEGLDSELRIGSVGELWRAAVKAVADAPAQTAGQAALYGGVAAIGVLVAGAVLESVDSIPLAAPGLQAVGAVYGVLIASQALQNKPLSFPPPSPFRAIIDFVEGPGEWADGLDLEADVTPEAATVLKTLARERDRAVEEVAELRRTAEKLTGVMAEKEALEAVALQLADERDGAMAEVSALKDAIGAMTTRIRGIEEMLEKEVSTLKEQNQALESVSLQLVAERNSAMEEVGQLRTAAAAASQQPPDEAKEALEMVAVEIAQERDSARAEVEELRRVVGILREATATASGLTSEQEVFIKARVRDVRSQFIDVSRAYEEQKDEVDRFIEHLVAEYGAPRDWTAEYIQQFLNSSATKSGPSALSGGYSQVENLAAQSSRNS